MLRRVFATALLLASFSELQADEPAPPGSLVGFTELQTNLPGGRHANVRTMRAAIVNADGTGRRFVAAELANEPDAWTQFAGWSPDGKTAIIGRGWQSLERDEERG